MNYTICLQTAIIESANRLIKGHIQNNTKRLLRYVGMYMIKLITHFAVCRMLNGRPIRKQDFEIPNGLIQSLFSVVHSTYYMYIKEVRKGVLFESFESISGKVVKHYAGFFFSSIYMLYRYVGRYALY